MSYILALFAVTADPSVQPSIVDGIAGSSLFGSSVDLLLNAIVIMIANKYRSKEWKVAIAVGMLLSAIICIRVLCSQSSISLINIITQSMPIIATTAWTLSALYFRYSIKQELSAQNQAIAAQAHVIAAQANVIAARDTIINQIITTQKTSESNQVDFIKMVAEQNQTNAARDTKHTLGIEEQRLSVRELKKIVETTEERINYELSKLNLRIEDIANPPNDNIVELPENSSVGARIQSGVTTGQFIQKLALGASVENQRLSATDYLGNYVTWACRIFRRESMPNGQLSITLQTMNNQNLPSSATVVISVPEYENAHLKQLPQDAEIIVNGRIHGICILPLAVYIDNVIVNVNSDIR